MTARNSKGQFTTVLHELTTETEQREAWPLTTKEAEVRKAEEAEWRKAAEAWDAFHALRTAAQAKLAARAKVDEANTALILAETIAGDADEVYEAALGTTDNLLNDRPADSYSHIELVSDHYRSRSYRPHHYS